MEIFRTVFGTDSGSKWSGVLATQAVSTAVTTYMKIGIDRHISNDAGAANALTKLFSHLAIAPYIGPVPSSDSTGLGLTMNNWLAVSQENFNQQLYDTLKLGAGSDGSWGTSDYYRAAWQAQKTVADSYGLGMMQYEGGYGAVTVTGIQNSSPLVAAFSAFGRDRRCAQLVYDMQTQYVTDTSGMASQFQMVGPPSKFGNWGAVATYDDITPRGSALDAFNLSAPWQQNRRNMRVVMTT
jgi:hypothetical protein